MKKNLTYRKCELKDLNDLVSLSEKTFIEAYEKNNNPEDFKLYIESAFNSNQIKSELENPNSEFYFIYLKNKRAGYFKLNQNDAQGEAYGSEAFELSRIYILKQYQGQDIGGTTVSKIIELTKEKHKTWLWLSVWQLNEDAVRFYERLGFVKYGLQDFYVGNDRQIDWLMRLDIV